MPKSDMQNPANIYDTCIHKRLDILLHGQLVYIGLITHYVRSIQKMHVCATITSVLKIQFRRTCSNI